MTRLLALLLATATTGAAGAGDLRVYPAEVPLTGPGAVQQLLVVEEVDGRTVADHTAAATFQTSNPQVAAVDEAGVVRPVGEGEVVVTAIREGRSAATKVRVTRAKESSSPS